MWPLTIDFDEFGWDWVLFPKTYEANFCSGDCSLGQLIQIIFIWNKKIFFQGVPTDTNHGTLTQHLSGGIGPCCAGKKMSDINMLYLDQERNVVFGKLPNMKVERCGCS